MVAKIKTIFQVYDLNKDFSTILEIDDVDITFRKKEILELTNTIENEDAAYSIVDIYHEMEIKNVKGTPTAFYIKFINLKKL